MQVELDDNTPEPTVEEILAEVERRRAARRAEEERYRSSRERRIARWAEWLGHWFTRHWLAVLNIWWFLYVGIPFLAPVLMKMGMEGHARLIYLAYQPLCHQLPHRSWYLFGEQPFYSMEELLRRGVAPELLVAHGYIGDAVLGYKVSLCQRDTAIYGTIFLAGLAFALTRRQWRPLPLWAYLLFGIMPVVLDGGIQLVSQILVSLFPTAGFVPVESTPLRRVVTGALFGWATVWILYPNIHRATRETSSAATKRSQ
jgi:uncharacterized membrane protein